MDKTRRSRMRRKSRRRRARRRTYLLFLDRQLMRWRDQGTLAERLQRVAQKSKSL